MNIKITIAEIIFILVISHYGAAQNHEIKFNLVKGNNGKPLGKINSITQDPHGYMWFSGQDDKCIYRYDGNRMISFRHDSLNKNSIGLTVFEKIYADQSGIIWIGGNGLEKFDPATGIFKHYRHDKTDSSSLVENEVTAILKDRKGRLWVGTTKGLDRFDEKTEKFIHYRNETGNAKSLSHNAINIIYEDHSGVIWVGTGFRWYGYQPGQGGLNRLEPDGNFTRYLHDVKNPYSLINNKVNAIFEDSRGVFWIGTNGDGLNIMNRETGSFNRIQYKPTKDDQLTGLPYEPDRTNTTITFIHEDLGGGIWIGTRGFGINRYDTQAKKFTHYQAGNGYPDNSGWCAFTSRDGVLWVSTEEDNLYRADPFLKKIDNITIGVGKIVMGFLEGNNGDLWVGTDGAGLMHYDQNNKLIRQFKDELSNSVGLPGVAIISLLQSQNDSICIGTMQDGILAFNRVKQKFSRFRYDGTIRDSGVNSVHSILQDREGYRWFARSRGLVRYNPKDRSVQEYHPNPRDSGSISTNWINCVIEDRNGNIWAGGQRTGGENTINGAGLNRLDKQTGRFRHYLPGINIVTIYEDSAGTIWAGTLKGLYRLKKGADTFYSFFDLESEYYDAHISGIIEDDHKNLWITAPAAIIKIDSDRNRTYSYGSKFGIAPNNVSGVVYKTANGRILVGNQQGFYSFFPDELEIKTSPFKVNITDFFIHNLPVMPGEETPLKKPVEEITDLVLKYNQNNFGFNFAANDYKSPEDNRYFTMLEGYDNAWRETGAEKSAYYFFINPDTYVFRVKAINSDGKVSEKAITIRINPPWWRTWLFRIAAVVCLVGLLYSLIRWRLQHKFRLQLERSEKERQMAELKQKGTELEMQALRAQMNPHFIFNSLNSINRFILQNNKAQASEYLTKFSKLVRMILQNSQASLITLENELESLELYLELEALRFNYHFDYEISVPKDMDISVLKVPPLILQPYVENAIWHGLMHKEEKGHLDIEIIEQNDHLYFKITDDGVGREKAAALASKSATKHKSMGLRITAHRIAILQNSEALTSPVTINDLVDADGNAAGTEVTIKIPVIYD